MTNWKYNPEDYGKIKPIPPGIYRVRIEEAEETTSKNTGKDMFKLTIKVSGYNNKIFHYLVLDDSSLETIERTNNNLGRIYDSFNIPQGSMNLQEWIGKVGAANIKNETDQQGTLRASIGYFIQRKRQDELPAWQEHPNAEKNIPF